MKIRKKFNVESAHIVRNCTSERCSHSIHGHSAIIELFFESDTLDNAQMVVDFGLFKKDIKQIIDAMDHCYIVCNKERNEFQDFIKKECDRYISLPFNPSAEMLTLFIYHYVTKIIEHTTFRNGEYLPRLTGVRYHETATGWAECDAHDYENLWKPEYNSQIEFSEGIRKEWSNELRAIVDGDEDAMIVNPVIEQQIEL